MPALRLRWLPLRNVLWTLARAWLLCLCLISAVKAEGIELRDLRVENQTESDSLVLQGDALIELHPRLEEAINRGLPLYFVLEVEITRGRWYWFDEKAAQASQTYRLSFNALTRQYRVSVGGLQLRFSTLSEAFGFITRIRNIKLVERSQLQPNRSYAFSVRLRLDINQLPKPFQINALTEREWNLSSGWQRFTYTPSEPANK
jgi:hypothetical protein